MPDELGYPSEMELATIRDWPPSLVRWPEAARAWLDACRALWWHAEWGWREREQPDGSRLYLISTGGWSGNESVIGAMREHVFWNLTWLSMRAGGHYTFRLARPIHATAP